MLAAITLWSFIIPIPHGKPATAREAVLAAVPRLIAGASGHADQKTCFACHNQAYPLLALVAARDRGITVPDKFFKAQSDHIWGFLNENKTRFRNGEGTGVQTASAAYALFALELAGHEPDDTTAAVSEFLLNFEPTRDHWRMTSYRPPTESSDFTTTYVAMRVLRTYGVAADKEKIAKRIEAARAWLIKASPGETEDRVFRLLALKEAGADERTVAAAAWDLLKTQRPDGGWSQLDDGSSDAYASGSALFALHHAGGLKPDSPTYQSGVAFLLKTQLADGTWKVKSRSKPFQPYYESGFPHEKDQFISISATGWATAALAASLKKN